MSELNGKRVAILATHGVEWSELTVPRDRLKEAGAEVDIVSPESGGIRGWRKKEWGDTVAVDRTLAEAEVADCGGLVIPGGQINPDILRARKDAVAFVRDFFNSKKPLAAICHAGWLLVEADVLRGRQATSYHSIKTDMRNAGAEWVDEEVVVHEGMITSRNPGDLPAFCDKIIEEIREGRHEARRVA